MSRLLTSVVALPDTIKPLPPLTVSEAVTTVLVFVVAVLWAKLLLGKTGRCSRDNFRFPPGPRGLPIVGYLPFINPTHPHLTYQALAERFGPIFRFYAGNKMIVVISDSHLIRDAFRKEAFTGRPRLALVDGIMEELGISASSGKLWKEQRSFSITVLKELGFSKIARNRSLVESQLLGIVNDLTSEIHRNAGQPTSLFDVISFAVVNVFFNVFTGNNFRFLDPNLMVHIYGNRQSFKDVSSMALPNFFPVFFRLPHFKRKLDNIYHRKIALQKVFEMIISNHKDGNDVKDFVSAYLKKMDELNECGNSVHHFSEKQLLNILGDLFGAVAETTTVNLQWFILAMAKHPDIQLQIQQELDDIIGQDRKPTLSDRQQLPYLEATIQETLRYASILPLGAARTTTEDAELAGYFIPKDTTVMGLFWKCNHDEKLWRNPNNFDPYNFLSEEGVVQKPSHFMPFSTGRRICLGEDLAMMILFLTCSHLLYHFDLSLAPNSLSVDMQHIGGYILEPEPFNVIARPRSSL